MKTKHFNIPVFIPELACPFRCKYCNQRKISGLSGIPDAKVVNKIIDDHLFTIPEKGSEIEIAFFGGNFTGLSFEKQKSFLDIANDYFKKGLVTGIRLSTRPDYIDDRVISFLTDYPVKTIEIGAQSMVDEVLVKSGRGHTARDTETAARLVKKAGFSLGLQMMIGLPGDSMERSLYTAQRIIDLGADNTRIYPTLVIRDTGLAEMYIKGEYKPLSLKEAIEWSALLLKHFENAGINVLRMGLHPSEGLLSGEDLIAGPFSPAFGNMVHTKIWEEILMPLLLLDWKENIEIRVAAGQLNHAIGYMASNKKYLLQKFRKVVFSEDPDLCCREYTYNGPEQP